MSETNNTIKSKQNQYHHLKTPLEALLEEFNDKNIILDKDILGSGVLRVESGENGRINVEIQREEIDFPHFIHNIVGRYDVKDFTVEEPKLEKVVKEIYVEGTE